MKKKTISSFKFFHQIQEYIGIPEEYPLIGITEISTFFAVLIAFYVFFNYLFSIALSNHITQMEACLQNSISFSDSVINIFSIAYINLFLLCIAICALLFGFSKQINRIITWSLHKMRKHLTLFLSFLIIFLLSFIIIPYILKDYLPQFSFIYTASFFILFTVFYKKITLLAKFIILFFIGNLMCITLLFLNNPVDPANKNPFALHTSISGMETVIVCSAARAGEIIEVQAIDKPLYIHANSLLYMEKLPAAAVTPAILLCNHAHSPRS